MIFNRMFKKSRVTDQTHQLILPSRNRQAGDRETCHITYTGGGCSEGWSRLAGSHSRGSGCGWWWWWWWVGNAENADGNCMKNGLTVVAQPLLVDSPPPTRSLSGIHFGDSPGLDTARREQLTASSWRNS